ncbi:UNVERIFIED_CONTAM: hypothetical protein NCL1_17198 [Trichonephila clavipes]
MGKRYTKRLSFGAECQVELCLEPCFKNHSPVHNGGNNPVKPNIIPRSNSLPASSTQRNAILRSNSMYSSPQMTRKKGYQSNAPFNNKPKHIMQKDSHNEQVISHPQNYPCMWNGMSSNLPTSPIPIPGKAAPNCYQTQQGSPEVLNELNVRNFFIHLFV